MVESFAVSSGSVCREDASEGFPGLRDPAVVQSTQGAAPPPSQGHCWKLELGTLQLPFTRSLGAHHIWLTIITCLK